MSSDSRYLITSSDERTWKFDRPVIFLGYWCLHYNRKHVWEKMDAVVAKPYGKGQSTKDIDWFKARKIEKNIFPILYKTLNQYHGTNYSSKFWKILLSSWLRRYVEVMFNRISTLRQCIETNNLTGVTLFDDEYNLLISKDCKGAIYQFDDNNWNNLLIKKLFEYFQAKNLFIETISNIKSESKSIKSSKILNINNLLRLIKINLKDQVKKIVMFLTSILSVRNQGVIQNTYLTKIDEIKLNLSLNSIPLYWTAYKSSNLKTNIDLNNLKQRKTLSYNYKNFSEDFVENIIGDMIFKILPICFLEGFKELNNIVSKRILPKNPKYIFTSNLYDTNEDFKLWTAKNVELGTKYIIGQHGSNFGTHRYINPSAEETIADKFITWGWTDNLKQHVPAFIFKITKFTQKINYSDGGLLLILTHVPHRYRLYDVIYENRNYFDNQILFVNKLKSSITKKLTIRKTPSGSALSLGEDVKFNQFHKSVKFDEGEIKIEKLINKSKIVVFTYDSTGMLECLAKNIPTIVFWDNTFDYIRDSAKPYYQMLIDSGILHSSPESASNKINQVWDNIDEWWLSNKTQIFRKKFCEKYATFSDSPINQLKEILLN